MVLSPSPPPSHPSCGWTGEGKEGNHRRPFHLMACFVLKSSPLLLAQRPIHKGGWSAGGGIRAMSSLPLWNSEIWGRSMGPKVGSGAVGPCKRGPGHGDGIEGKRHPRQPDHPARRGAGAPSPQGGAKNVRERRKEGPPLQSVRVGVNPLPSKNTCVLFCFTHFDCLCILFSSIFFVNPHGRRAGICGNEKGTPLRADRVGAPPTLGFHDQQKSGERTPPVGKWTPFRS